MKALFSVCCLLLMVGTVHPNEKPNPEDAVALVKAAIAHFSAKGADQAFADLMDPDGGFIKGELYIFVLDGQGITVAHGMNPRLAGKDYLNLKDVDGKFFQKEFLKIGLAGRGWVDYKYTNPVSRKVEPKTAYVEGHGGYVFGCGIYK